MVTLDPGSTLRALLARRELDLRLASDGLPADALEQPIRWVHSTDLADPTPFLTDQVVLLTTGTQFGDDTGYDEYVGRLVDRGITALGFGTEVVRDGIPAGLRDACDRRRMPLFEVPYSTPFIAVARANADAIAAQAYARRSWALSAQRAIALAALRPDGLGATIAELAKQLDTWVGMYDAAGALVREHPTGTLDAATVGSLGDEVGAVLRRGAHSGSSLRSSETAFTLQTLGRGGALRGVLAIGSGTLDREGRDVVTAVLAMAGLALEQHQRLSRARAALRTGVVHALRAGDVTLAGRIARDVGGPLPTEPIVVAVADAAGTTAEQLLEFLELRAEERQGSVFSGADEDGAVIVVREADDAVLEEAAMRFGVRVGVSGAGAYDGFETAHAEALLARDRGAAAVSRVADLRAGGILSLVPDDAGATLARALLDPLAPELAATVRAWLHADGSHEQAALALGVHRHTVRTRLAAAERTLGVDLSSFAVRAELWAAFRLVEG
ncbi:PucR family transcriptional regulator [Microbacterium dauci]|uniref:PucR family transcriptional regulator n=1 Tax=Microbacterium dauci TaxID=3048008 RepID=A0ABT6ZF59_9MICO|nr:PucR family transcriptional regulator [Microbacterium sp. LX3-4]MDJ1114803.1 PucR family transcriptional regulator [Microbacterium sp. LX3-4]